MASSTPPPPHCSISTTTAKPSSYQQNPPPQTTHHRNRQRQPWTHHHHHHRFSLTNNHPPPHPKPTTFPRSDLSAHFSGRRSTRIVSKLHFGRPKATIPTRHSFSAEEALQQLIQFGRDDRSFDNVLFSFQSKFSGGSDDFIFLLREFGNRGEYFNALRCFDFAIKRERNKCELGKLASAMISVLGRSGQVDLARRVFDTAVRDGYGNTVYAYSALISAYGRSGCCDDAVRVFESMKSCGLRPNLVTYNAVIDACGKGGVEFKRVTEIFEEMFRNGVQPDRITYNSLLAVCSRHGLWEAARNMFDEMMERGIDQDIFTYNTLLDAVCKGGQMDLASEIMAEMPARNILPNVVTYSTMIDGYAKAGRPEDALGLFYQMKCLGIILDRVSYNTLLSLYAKLGRFEEALDVCREMEISGIRKDVVTYNALLGGYGKQGKYDEVRRVFQDMKAERVSPNLLTYSTVIDVYSKGGLYREAMEVYKEFRQSGLKADVVLYSALIDALCKSGLVQYAVTLLDEMTKEGIKPNVVTYNSIIDAFGRSAAAEYTLASSESSSAYVIEAPAAGDVVGTQDNQIVRMFTQLASERPGQARKDNQGRHELMCILGVFQMMHELKIKPNVVTFSAILNACSRCNSFEDASMLLESLHLFDNQVYGVAHGLLMGCNENVWVKAQSLFDQVREMDTPTASAFYNALTDMLWHFGQRKGAQLVVLEGKRRQVWENVWSDSCLDLHLMSSGAARAMVHAWLLNIRTIVFEGHELPKLLSILTGWGKHSKVVGDSTLRRAIEALLMSIGAPFRVAQCNLGRFISTGPVVAAWLRESGTLNVLVLHDDRTPPESVGYNTRASNLQALAF